LNPNIENVCNSIESEKLSGLFEGVYDRKPYNPKKTRKQKQKVYISG
jgi:viroplasmin and RNaseH domain-containing protein